MTADCPIASELAERVSGATVVRRNEPLARRTTLRVGGPADVYVEPDSEQDMSQVVQYCAEHSVQMFVLGRGSNLLVKDGGFRGVVICLAHANFSRVEVKDQRLVCGAGARLKAVAIEAKRQSLSGLEFLEGIPGSVGGAMFDAVETVRLMDFSGNVRECPAPELGATYRSCPAFKSHIALGAVLRGRLALRQEIEQRMKEFSQKRWKSQPAAPSAGCIFKNPPAIPAGKLIDELSLKGMRIGGAYVSYEHGNFIVTDGAASARDVLDLIEIIRQRARQMRGLDLETEVQIIGE
jgi:UDP-N-acetylenolpyruvoylglucosamine reductase